MIKILIAGDFCPMDRVAELIEKEDYKSVFGEVCEYTSKTDCSIVNLEAPVVETPVSPIEKCGPNLKCTSKAVSALKYAGFDVVTLANNHFYDYGDEGVMQTLDTCKKERLETVGGGMNLSDASKIFYKEVKGVRFAIINCCEHEFSIATDKSGGSNPLNPIQQYYAIQEAKQRADKVILIIHGGHEHYQLPSPRMKETYHFFVDAGADAVVNHHQHCYSGYEVYKGVPIFYGLGNFCFDWIGKRNEIWNEGYMLELAFDTDLTTFSLIPYVQGNDEAGVLVIKDEIANQKFYNRIIELNELIADDIKLKESHESWMIKTAKGYLLTLEPYQGRVLTGLYVRKLLPSFLTKLKLLHLIDYIDCEAHLDRIRFAIKNKISKTHNK